ncbi:class I SAM-dependent methyltransferase [Nocardiopsis sp. ATB16-24]|uniref:class I SAM-dependent methyltransferase n=1 Tax=Nocardiopsis sp. ATB16-24 TaxID=3019555 RepID=UPI00255237D5|nr:class I SAM-dependent methyltransferase [Nocardiopsis sp. ATB16-24]
MNTTEAASSMPEWLALREEADARARATEPLTELRDHARVVADLGCGTGSLGRWLTSRLPGERSWLLLDRDPELLEPARASVPGAEVIARRLDLESLRATDLEGVTLVTASALLDVLTRAEVRALTGAVATRGCPALLCLSVVGRVEFLPADPLDGAFGAAFDDHQRRRGRLGPDAPGFATAAFTRLGYEVRSYPSPWRLGPGDAELTRAWLRGWVRAAVEQDGSLPGEEYLQHRLSVCAGGNWRVVVHHTDLLALPRAAR